MDTHFAPIARRWERATLTARPDGSHVVRIPSMPLHGKYEQPWTDVWFVVPVGFPFAQRSDSELVLHALREAGRFSVWDMDDKHICAAVMGLQRAGRIRTDPDKFGFPWTAVEIIEPNARPKLRRRASKAEGR